MSETKRIECPNCGERNDFDNQKCTYCETELNKDDIKECPNCGVLISTNLRLCKLCSALEAKSGASGCIFALSILVFFIGIVCLFVDLKLGLIIITISVAVYGLLVLFVKFKFAQIESKYNVKRKMPL